MVGSEEAAIIERSEPPKRMCYDLLYVYLILGFILVVLQIVNQLAGNFLREYALILTIGILLSMLLFTLYYVWINPPIRPSELGMDVEHRGISSSRIRMTREFLILRSCRTGY